MFSFKQLFTKEDEVEKRRNEMWLPALEEIGKRVDIAISKFFVDVYTCRAPYQSKHVLKVPIYEMFLTPTRSISRYATTPELYYEVKPKIEEYLSSRFKGIDFNVNFLRAAEEFKTGDNEVVISIDLDNQYNKERLYKYATITNYAIEIEEIRLKNLEEELRRYKNESRR